MPVVNPHKPPNTRRRAACSAPTTGQGASGSCKKKSAAAKKPKVAVTASPKSPPSPKKTAILPGVQQRALFDSPGEPGPAVSKAAASLPSDSTEVASPSAIGKTSVDVNNVHTMCQLSTGMRITNDVLHDSGNPQRVFCVIDDDSKRYSIDACFDLVHAVATKFAVEAHSKGGTQWSNIFVVVHDNYMEAFKAVQASGGNEFVFCHTKDDASSVNPVPKTPDNGTGAAVAAAVGAAGPVAATGVGGGSPSSASGARPAAAGASHGAGMRSPSTSPSKQLNLDNLGIKVGKDVVQKYKKAKDARSEGTSSYKLVVRHSGVVVTSGRAKVVGTFTVEDRRNNVFWVFKPDAVIDTLQALTENSHLAPLSQLALSATEIDLRDIPHGADVGRLSYSKTGSAFPVTTVMFSLDVSEKIWPAEEDLLCLLEMLHEVITSNVFKDVYTDMMINGGGRWEKLGAQIKQDNHACWVIFKGCTLDIVGQSPLNTTMMDKDIKNAMAFMTGGVPPGSWASDSTLSKVAYKGGAIPAGTFTNE